MHWGPFDLTGKGVCVTGGGGHLGSAISTMLAEAGASVVIVGRNEEALSKVVRNCESVRGTISYFVGDISNDETILDVCRELSTTSEGLTGFVNNAHTKNMSRGFDFSRQDASEITEALVSTMVATKLASQDMINRGAAGSIVNIASIYGLVSPDPSVYLDYPEMHNPAAYGATKAGILQFTRYAAVHLAKNEIRVNSITPGAFPNRGTRENLDFIKMLTKKIPLGRLGVPNEIAGAVIFLMSNASTYITGSNLVIDGGWTAL